MNKPDSIIFDMDGTLWDPMDVYVTAWNTGLKEAGVDKEMTPEEIKPLMGMEGKKVLALVLPEYPEERRMEIYAKINHQRGALMSSTLGKLFPGMVNGLDALSKHYKLFILSNCPLGIVEKFIKRAGIEEYITDYIEYGMNFMPKHHNMALLKEKYQLESPVYVGDTDGDREQSDIAGLPFVFLTCGYGKTDKYAVKFDSFSELTYYFEKL